MNHLNSSLSNIQFLNVSHYLSMFSIFFASIDMMTIDDQNQSIPVINTLFEYLGKSPNESEAKNQLLQKVLIEFNTTGKEDKRRDMKYVNETYQYIIATLFDHENITRYLIRMNQPQNINSSFQKLLKIWYRNLLENNIRNVCPTRNESTKLSPLAIGKILYEYILPSIQRTGISREENKLALKRFRRMSPEDIDINNTNQTETLRTLELLLDEAVPVQTDGQLGPEGLDNFDDWVNFVNSDEGNEAEFFLDTSNGLDDIGLLDHEREFHDISPNREADDELDNFEDLINFVNFDESNGRQGFNNILDKSDDIGSSNNEREITDVPSVVDNRPDNIVDLLNSNEGDELEFVGNTFNDAEGIRPLVNEEINLPESQIQESFESRETLQETPGVVIIAPRKHKLGHDTNIPGKVQKIDYENSNWLINSKPAGADPILSDKPGTSKEARTSMNYLHPELANDNGKSKRLQYIEKSAKFITLCKPHKTFDETVNNLKGFLLKLENSTTLVPTYDDYANDYCQNSKELANYNNWQIPNDRFINDVLFDTYFNQERTLKEVMGKMQFVLPSKVFNIVPVYFEMYKNSPILHQSLLVEDFLLLKLTLENEINIRHSYLNRRVKAALYRLALRECEEEWVENNITLFGVQKKQGVAPCNKNYCTFTNLMQLSQDRENEESKLVDPVNIKKQFIEYEIEFENLAGIVRVDRIFDGKTTERFVIPLNTTLSITSSKCIRNIGKKIVCLYKLVDKLSKEKKMKDMVEKLYNILRGPDNLFAHYN